MTAASDAEEWKTEGLRYAQAINDMVEFAIEHGWEAYEGEAPEDGRSPALAERVIEGLVLANAEGSVDAFRESFPPAHAPFAESLGERGQHIAQVTWIDDERLAFIAGTPMTSQQGYLLNARTEELTALEDTRGVAASSDRQHFARVTSSGIHIHAAWDSQAQAQLPFPTTWDDEGPLRELDHILVLPGGSQVVAVSGEGIFLIDGSGAKRIHPEPDPDDDEWTPDSDMAHAAVSPNGQLLCVGDQCSKHRILGSDGAEIASIGSVSSYPHHAVFSHDGGLVAMNACHLYNGATLVADTTRLAGLDTDEYLEADNLPDPCHLIDGNMRVYASAVLPGQFLLGDAGGYVRSVSEEGEYLWQHFVGSSISSLALSPNGKQLAIASYSGTLHLIDLDQPQADPSQIGTHPHVERRRWLFWRDQAGPLKW